MIKLFRSFLSNSIFVLNIFLLVLFFFRDKLSIPVWVQPFGRMHPMLLHLPIGILLLAGFMIVFKSGFKKKSFHNFLNFILYLAAFTAALTALLGMLLSAEGGYAEVQLQRHVVAGVAVSLITWIVLTIAVNAPGKKSLLNGFLAADIIVMLLAGHFGSVLTHGENFIFQPLQKEDAAPVVVTDSTSLYTAAIYPLLERKCVSCHNEKKSKGGLIMTSIEKLTTGGEHGVLWHAGDPQNSLLIKRIHLPEENEDHMPPSGKPQLTHAEKQLLFQWILNDADMQKAWTKYTAGDSLQILANEFIKQSQKPAEVHYPFSFVAADKIEELNTPYCSVSQLAMDEPAVKADFFLAQSFDSKKLAALLAVKDQLVILNLTGMPLTSADAETIRQFEKLERIILNKTAVTTQIITAVSGLKNLKSISLASTSVTPAMAKTLGASSSLREVFLWNTPVTPEDVASLQQQFPKIHWDGGYHTNEILRLTPPLLVNESLLLPDDESIRLKHSMPGTQIRYTLDGTVPDSVHSPLYEQPIAISGYTHLKAKAFKTGWYGSLEVGFYFFKQGIKPLNARLVYPPNKDYKGDGAASLIDSRKGRVENFREAFWLGFREQPLVCFFQVDPSSPVESVTISYGRISNSLILPPLSAEIWGGDDSDHLKLLQRQVPLQPLKNEPGHMEALQFTFPRSSYPVYKLVATPVPTVPASISAKPQKGWLFVDEVIFN